MLRRMSNGKNDTRCHYRAAGVAESVFFGGGVCEEGVVVVYVARNARHLPCPGKKKRPTTPLPNTGTHVSGSPS